MLNKVEFVTKVPGEFQEIAVVHLEGKEPQKLTILGKVSKPALEILSCKDEMIVPRVSFGNTYYGTDRTERALLYNNGPEVVSFVAIVDENAVAQELVRYSCRMLRCLHIRVDGFSYILLSKFSLGKQQIICFFAQHYVTDFLSLIIYLIMMESFT